jgi:hypothetical protein
MMAATRKARLVKQNRLPGTNYIRQVPGPEFELVELTPEGEYVVRAEAGDVTVVPPFIAEAFIAVQCDRCGRFGGDVSRMDDGGWTCSAENSADACGEAARLETWDRRHEES